MKLPRRLVLLIGAQLALSALGGVVWQAWSPPTTAYVLAATDGSKFLIPAQSEGEVAGAGRFAVIALLIGLVMALSVWWLVRERRAWILPVLIGSGIAGTLITRAVGSALSSGPTTGALNTAIQPPLRLHGWPWLGLQAIVAVVVYLVLLAVFLAPEPDELDSDGPLEEPASLVSDVS
jgi:hypothetical protein